jgi:AraC-like DNA-binding protein
MLNYWAIILLLAAGQGILLGIALLLPGRKRDHSNPFLGLMIIIISLELLNAWGMQVKYHQSKNVFPFWLLESYLILPVSLWLFVKATIEPGFRFRIKHLLFYIPAFIEIAVETTMYIRYKFTGQSIRLLDIKPWFYFTEVLPIIWMIASLIFYGIELSNFYRQLLKATRSNNMTRLKVYGLFVLFSLLTVCWAGEVLIHLPIFTFIEAFLICFLFALGYIGYARPAFFDRIKLPAKKITDKQSFSNYDDKKESRRLVQLLEQKALYTRPGLTLEELSRELDLPVRYVSYLINSYFATNFHHFINSYRVKEVIHKIKDPAQKNKTLLALAFESGFNSKSSFNKVFRDHTGQSPSHFMSKYVQKDVFGTSTQR